MDRKEHLQWCKDRAIEYVDDNDLPQALASFISDMSKHSGTATPLVAEMGMSLTLSGKLSTAHEMKEWINGFN